MEGEVGRGKGGEEERDRGGRKGEGGREGREGGVGWSPPPL